MSGLFGTVAYGEVLEVGKTDDGGQVITIAGTADDLRVAARMLYRRAAILEVADLEALTSKVAEGVSAELELAKAKRELDGIHAQMTAAGIPGSRAITEDWRQVLLLEDRVELALAERVDLRAEVARLTRERDEARAEVERLRGAVEAVLHQLQHGEARDGDERDIAWCAAELTAALAPPVREHDEKWIPSVCLKCGGAGRSPPFFSPGTVCANCSGRGWTPAPSPFDPRASKKEAGP